MQETARILRKRDKNHWAQQPRFLDGVNSPYYTVSAASSKRIGTSPVLPTLHEGRSSSIPKSLNVVSTGSEADMMVSKLDGLVLQAGYSTGDHTALSQSQPTAGFKGHAGQVAQLSVTVKQRVQALQGLTRRTAVCVALVCCFITASLCWFLWHGGATLAFLGALVGAETLFWIQFKRR